MISVTALVELTLGGTTYPPGERFELPDGTDEERAEASRLESLGLVEVGPRVENGKGRPSPKK